MVAKPAKGKGKGKGSKTGKADKDPPPKVSTEVVVGGLTKRFGAGVIMDLSGTPTVKDYVFQVPTGSLLLDVQLASMKRKTDGRWNIGLPSGQWVEISGEESSGKTTLCAHIVTNAQKQGLRCAFIDMEHAVDRHYFRKLGVDLTLLTFSQPNSGEQALEIVDVLLKSGLYGIIVIDSVAALVPQAELNGEMGDSLVGAQARMLAKACRKYRPELGAGNPTTLIFTNQRRYKVVRFGNPETTAGGEAVKYSADIRIHLTSSGKEAPDDVSAGKQQIRAFVRKNKAAPPHTTAFIELRYGEGFNLVGELVDLCVNKEIITISGSWYGVPGAPQQCQGKSQVEEYVNSTPGLGYWLYNAYLTQVQKERGLFPDGKRNPDAPPPPQMTPAADLFKPVKGDVILTDAPKTKEV